MQRVIAKPLNRRNLPDAVRAIIIATAQHPRRSLMPELNCQLSFDRGSLRLGRLWLGALSVGVLIIHAIVSSSLYGAWRSHR